LANLIGKPPKTASADTPMALLALSRG
jgi:hypothetical protein